MMQDFIDCVVAGTITAGILLVLLAGWMINDKLMKK